MVQSSTIDEFLISIKYLLKGEIEMCTIYNVKFPLISPSLALLFKILNIDNIRMLNCSLLGYLVGVHWGRGERDCRE